MALSKTQQAIALMARGKPLAEAAKEAGVAEGTIRVAMHKRKGRNLCPCCGQIVREGFELDTSVLKNPEGE